MVDYIPRSEAINELRHRCYPCGEGIEAINVIPAADVAPVVHGRWEVVHVPNRWDKARCSACKRLFKSYEWGTRCCSACGAKLDGGVSDAGL